MATETISQTDIAEIETAIMGWEVPPGEHPFDQGQAMARLVMLRLQERKKDDTRQYIETGTYPEQRAHLDLPQLIESLIDRSRQRGVDLDALKVQAAAFFVEIARAVKQGVDDIGLYRDRAELLAKRVQS